MTNNDAKKAIKSYNYSAISADNRHGVAKIELEMGEIETSIEDFLYSVFYAGRASLAADIANSYNGPDEETKRAAEEPKAMSRHLTGRIIEAARLAMEAAHV